MKESVTMSVQRYKDLELYEKAVMQKGVIYIGNTGATTVLSDNESVNMLIYEVDKLTKELCDNKKEKVNLKSQVQRLTDRLDYLERNNFTRWIIRLLEK